MPFSTTLNLNCCTHVQFVAGVSPRFDKIIWITCILSFWICNNYNELILIVRGIGCIFHAKPRVFNKEKPARLNITLKLLEININVCLDDEWCSLCKHYSKFPVFILPKSTANASTKMIIIIICWNIRGNTNFINHIRLFPSNRDKEQIIDLRKSIRNQCEYLQLWWYTFSRGV